MNRSTVPCRDRRTTSPRLVTPAVLVGALVLLGAAEARAQIYFVSNSGDDANDGLTAPWKTIQHAADFAPPGSVIRVMDGSYPERVTIRNPNLTFAGRGYGAPGQAIVDATTVSSANRGPYHPVFRVVNTQDITIKDFVITNHANPDTSDCPGNDCPINMGVLVFTTVDEDPDHPDNWYPGAPPARHVTITGNLFTRVDRPPYGIARGAIGVFVYGKDPAPGQSVQDVVVDGNQFYDNAMSADWNSNAVLFAGNAEDGAVRGNTFSNFRPAGPSPKSYVVGVTAVEAGGNDPGLPLGPTNHARGIVISGNLVERTLAGGSGWGEVLGVYVQGGQRVLVERNQFDGALHGVAVHNERVSSEADYTQQVWIRDNVIRNAVFASGGSSFDLSVGDPTWTAMDHNGCYRPVKDVYVTNNTFWHAGLMYNVERVLFFPGILGDSVFRDNLMQSNYSFLYWTERDTPLGGNGYCVGSTPPAFPDLLTSDYNLFYSTQDPSQTIGPYFRYVPPWVGSGARQLWEQYRSLSGFDAHSTILAPQLSNPPDPAGFTLLPSSPAIDAGGPATPSWVSGAAFFGLYTPATELDHYDGVRFSGPANPPIVDIGADEYQAP